MNPTKQQTKKDEKVKANDKAVKQGKKDTTSASQLYMKIAEIRDDAVVLKNGGIRGILEVNSINFNLKSEDEQNAIIYSYQGFLNSLEFPIQVCIRSKRLDIDNYMDKLSDLGEKQTNALLQRQTYEYMDYIQRLVEYADIMEKSFYVVVPFDPFRSVKPNIVQRFFQNMSPKDSAIELQKRHKEFINLKKGLNQRMNIVKSGLQGTGLQVKSLTTKDLIELFYETYNPLTSRVQKFDDLEELNIKKDSDVLDETAKAEMEEAEDSSESEE